ncbi:carbohydrate sulfotransferase 3 [Galendromus occidentalis]|uniref:Carbohydrate sulfotransferase 3 n=1 Tax=Galendromus occidentalis TaxID=34638 RepID=A0AAJ7L609_9ACAR|nr:carbohydrate sulfotransferase 3 [Galendromus occidentalis]
MGSSRTIPAKHTLLRQRTGHPLQTLVSRRNGCLVGLIALCSTLIILVQVVSYNDKGSLYQTIVKGDSALQGLLQQGELLASNKDVLQGSTAKNAQVAIANIENGVDTSLRSQLNANVVGGKIPVLPLMQNADRLAQAMLKLYKVVPQSEVKRLIIVSYFRSGSTFLGDILQSPLKTFYHFEPFHITRTTRLRFNDISELECAKLFYGLLKCDFEHLPEYMTWVSQHRNQFLFRHNQFLWRHCALKNNICFNATYVEGMCRRSPLQVVKFVRFPLRYAVKFVTEEPAFSKNTAIVHLIRDPRAILASRRRLDWCKDECARADALCSQMGEDLDAFDELRKLHPEIRMVQIKLEELASNPFVQTRALFAALGLKFDTLTEAFLRTHTHHGSSDPYSTRRNSAAVAYDWQQKLSLKETLDIQMFCESIITKASYDNVRMNHRGYGNKVAQNESQWPAEVAEDNQTVT